MKILEKIAKTVNPVYVKESFDKKNDILELYKIEDIEDAKKYMADSYDKLKLLYETLLQKGPIFLVKYQGNILISVGPDLNISTGKKEVLRRFKDQDQEKVISIPVTFEECQRFLSHLFKNYKDEDFTKYIKELKSVREDFGITGGATSSREYIDAKKTKAESSIETVEEVPPFILKEIKKTEEKLKVLKEIVNLHTDLNSEKNEKIKELMRTIDFTNPESGSDEGNFHRSSGEEASFVITGPASESTFYRTAPDNLKKCKDCDCTEEDCCSEDEDSYWVDGKCICCK